MLASPVVAPESRLYDFRRRYKKKDIKRRKARSTVAPPHYAAVSGQRSARTPFWTRNANPGPSMHACATAAYWQTAGRPRDKSRDKSSGPMSKLGPTVAFKTVGRTRRQRLCKPYACRLGLRVCRYVDAYAVHAYGLHTHKRASGK